MNFGRLAKNTISKSLACVWVTATLAVTGCVTAPSSGECNLYVDHTSAHFNPSTALNDMINARSAKFNIKRSNWMGYTRIHLFIPTKTLPVLANINALIRLATVVVPGATVIPEGMGDNRDFKQSAHPKLSRVTINIDFQDAYYNVIANSSRVNFRFVLYGATVYTQTIDFQARTISETRSLDGGNNTVWAQWINDRAFGIGWHFVNGAPNPADLAPAIDGRLLFDLESRNVALTSLDGYPSIEVYNYNAIPCANSRDVFRQKAGSILDLAHTQPPFPNVPSVTPLK